MGWCPVRVKVAISGLMLRRMLRRPDLGCESLPGFGWLVANNSVPHRTMSTPRAVSRLPERAARSQPPPAGGADAGPALGQVRHDLLLACRIHRRRRGRRSVRLTGSRHVARPRGDNDGPLRPATAGPAAPGSAGVSGCHTRRGGGSRSGPHRPRRGLLAPGRGSGRSPSGTPCRGRSWSSSGRRCRPRARTC